MARRKFKPVKFVSFVELSEDIDELMELYSQAESLNVQAENELKLRRNERELIRAKLRKARQNLNELHISDHAIVRYLERVVGIDIDACKKEMLRELPDDINFEENGGFVQLTSGNMQYVIRDNLIISVTPKKEAAGIE